MQKKVQNNKIRDFSFLKKDLWTEKKTKVASLAFFSYLSIIMLIKN